GAPVEVLSKTWKVPATGVWFAKSQGKPLDVVSQEGENCPLSESRSVSKRNCLGLLGEFRAHRDLRLQESGDGAPFLGRVRGGLELRGVGAWDLRRHVEADRLDRPACVCLVEVQGRLRLNAFRPIADLLEFARKGHRETPRVRGGHEFFRVR